MWRTPVGLSVCLLSLCCGDGDGDDGDGGVVGGAFKIIAPPCPRCKWEKLKRVIRVKSLHCAFGISL